MKKIKIEYIKLKQYKYELSSDLKMNIGIYGFEVKHKFFTLDKDGNLVIFKSYKWDGVSGPMIDTKNSMIGGCVHDALYQMIRLGLLSKLLKSKMDEVMMELFKRCGMWEFRAEYAYYGVAVFGHKSCIVGDIHIPKTIKLEY